MTGWYVSAADIRHWTETSKRVAEDTLPLLIKKLILASCKPQNYDFPSGDNVAVGGWDGILEVDTDSPFIPKGTSGWEFGTNSNVKGKADSDFSKRSTAPAPLEPASSTFVFVTSRLWTKKDNWVRSKLQLNRWKDVRGINAETLSEWLEQCPAVHRWFSGLIGKRSAKVKDTSQAWDDFTNATKVQITKEYILHGRDSEISRLLELTRGDAVALRIKSSSIIESYAFILSALQTDDSTLARSLVIYDQSS